MGVLSNFFGYVYDSIFNIYNANISNVFNYFFDSGFYVIMGTMFVLIPALLMSVFYFIWKNPYGKWYHWLIMLAIIVIVVAISTYGYAESFINYSNAQVMSDCYNDDFCQSLIKDLPFDYAIANFASSALISIVFSIIFKQFSKLQAHLPF